MVDQKRFLVDVAMRNMPFPMSVLSKYEPNGQHTVANISISARIMQAFEPRWIDRFIKIFHEHRNQIGTHTLKANILDYQKRLSATCVSIDFDYPYFVEKLTPVSRQKCLVRYFCTYVAKVDSIMDEPRIIFKIQIPCITTCPGSILDKSGGLLGQQSIVTIEAEAKRELFPEDLVEIVDNHALSPVYSYLSENDQTFMIDKIHSEKKSSVVMVDEIKNELMHQKNIGWCSIQCANFSMLHSYNTLIGTEKSPWVPFSGYEQEI